MRIVIFCHSIVSDWNHGNAHFLRGIASEFVARGHTVDFYEPADSWSLQNLLRDYSPRAVTDFHAAFPKLRSTAYHLDRIDLESELADADLVLVHEWNDPALVHDIGEVRRRNDFTLFFHDTHHRAVTRPAEMAQYDLSAYDGVLVFGRVLRDVYIRNGWAKRVWAWHEAADIRTFRPMPAAREVDVIWIGNWGDDERTSEIFEFLIEPVRRLKLRARVHGVRYPDHAIRALADAGIEYAGWLPNYQAPAAYARARLTVHIPRAPYARALAGIPTIRPFEALACGIPLISAPWQDVEGLFRPGDFLTARSGDEMTAAMELLLRDSETARQQSMRGLETIRLRHTCAHRVDQLLRIAEAIQTLARPGATTA